MPEQIIVLDSNLIGKEPADDDNDSDSDMEGVEPGGDSAAAATSKKPTGNFPPDIQELIQIQEERNQRVMREKQQAAQQQGKALLVPQVADKGLPADGVDATLSVIVQSEHSYSVSQKGATLLSGDEATVVSPQRRPDDARTGVLPDLRTEVLPDLSVQERTANDRTEQDASTSKGVSPTEQDPNSSALNLNSGEETNTALNLNSGEETNTALVSNKEPSVNMGYNIQGHNVSHSRWLILQGNFAPGIMPMHPGNNMQDNTLVNACTVTVRRSCTPPTAQDGRMTIDNESLPERIGGAGGRTRRTLLWDFVNHDDGDFVPLARPCVRKTWKVFGRDDLLNTKWGDISAMVTG